jgi:putative transposase
MAASTAWEILKNAGIDPAPRRTAPTWSQFLRSQAEAVLACDFFTEDLLDGTQVYVLAVIEHATRRIRILGITRHPTGEWTTQQARNLLMDLGEQAHPGQVHDPRPRIELHRRVRRGPCRRRRPDRALQRGDASHERDRRTLDRRMLPRAPGPPPHLEPEPSAAILRDYENHYNQHRPHRSPQAAAPMKPLPEQVDLDQYRVRRQARVGGMIGEYRLVA